MIMNKYITWCYRLSTAVVSFQKFDARNNKVATYHNQVWSIKFMWITQTHPEFLGTGLHVGKKRIKIELCGTSIVITFLLREESGDRSSRARCSLALFLFLISLFVLRSRNHLNNGIAKKEPAYIYKWTHCISIYRW